jgi:hypothetical protein
MTPRIINIVCRRAVILSALLGIIASGFQQVEVHSHTNAYPGHVHGQDSRAAVASADVEEVSEDGVMHAHDIGALTLTPVPAIDLHLVAHRQAEKRIPPSTASPPDNLITPLYRPPKA